MSEATNSLLTAAELQPEVAERRMSQNRNWTPWRDRRRRARIDVGLEISSLGISMAFVSRNDAGQVKLTTDFFSFAVEKKLWTTESLVEPLQELVAKYRLQGQTVFIALGSEACVTRTLFGTNDEVDAGYRELLERSNHFLALGQGNRIHCHSEASVDAKRKRAFVTIAQRSVIEAVSQAVEQARLRLGKIEHSTAVLCQAVGHAGLDSDQPVLLVLTNSHVASLVLSFRGQLILDYRPAAATHETCQIDHWCESIRKHQKCLQRYLQSQLPRQHDCLERICIPGSNWSPIGMVSKKVQSLGLKLESLPISQLDPQLVAAETHPSAEMLAAIWMARSISGQTAEHPLTADLFKSYRPDLQLSFQVLLKAFWPVAAVLLIIVTMYVGVSQQRWALSHAETIQDQQSAQRLELQRLDQENAEYKGILTKASLLKSRLHAPSSDLVIKLLGRSLIEGMWLRQVTVLPDGQLQIFGTSYSNEGIYEYLAKLKETGLVNGATLISTRSVRNEGGNAFEFELSGVWSQAEPYDSKSASLSTAIGVPIN